jgi:hypothetical protein
VTLTKAAHHFWRHIFVVIILDLGDAQQGETDKNADVILFRGTACRKQ